MPNIVLQSHTSKQERKQDEHKRTLHYKKLTRRMDRFLRLHPDLAGRLRDGLPGAARFRPGGGQQRDLPELQRHPGPGQAAQAGGVSAESPAPGVVYIHGYQNNRETSDAYAIEMARRGFVVLEIDAIGRGNSGDPGRPR